MNLTKNFTLEEMTASSFAARNGINNVPTDDEILGNLMMLAQGLEAVRIVVGEPIIVTSGYRSPKVNSGVHGSKNSAHMKGLAADIKVHGLGAKELAGIIAEHYFQIGYDQLINEFGQWVHIAFPDVESKPRGRILTARRGASGTEYIEGLV
jgi:hypothetical protein